MDPADANLDGDDDSFTNLEEFLAQTNPGDKTSMPTGDCGDETVVITDHLYPSDAVINCPGSVYIIAGPDVTVPALAEVTYSAPIVKLRSGFRVLGEGMFHVVNEPADPKDSATKQYVDMLRTDVEAKVLQLEADVCRLYAVGGQPLPSYCPFRYVFVSDTFYRGDLVTINGDPGLTGVEAADALCQAAAETAIPDPLPGSYKAWIAIDATDDPESRFIDTGLPWVLVDGTVVAADWADLSDGALMVAIKITETGSNAVASDVWTNVNVDGTATDSYNCIGWTDPFDLGNYGSAGSATQAWTENQFGLCLGEKRLYCFQQ